MMQAYFRGEIAPFFSSCRKWISFVSVIDGLWLEVCIFSHEPIRRKCEHRLSHMLECDRGRKGTGKKSCLQSEQCSHYGVGTGAICHCTHQGSLCVFNCKMSHVQVECHNLSVSILSLSVCLFSLSLSHTFAEYGDWIGLLWIPCMRALNSTSFEISVCLYAETANKLSFIRPNTGQRSSLIISQ